MIRTYYLVISAISPPKVRTRRPTADQLGVDQICVALKVTIPDGWGRLYGETLAVTLPPPPEITLEDESDTDELSSTG